MNYTIEQTEDKLVINIIDNGDIYRSHTFYADVDDVELLAETLLNDALVDKEREGQPA